MKAWPVAISAEDGAFHGLVDPSDIVIDYADSVRIARSLLDAIELVAPAVPPSSLYGLQVTLDVWTVTIAGSERHHRTNERRHRHRRPLRRPRRPTANYPYAYNDLRGISSETIVLTSDNIRRVAQIRLACRHLDRHIKRANTSAQYAVEADEIGLTLARTALVTSLVRLLMDELGYGI